jgi:hypothetical protein
MMGPLCEAWAPDSDLICNHQSCWDAAAYDHPMTQREVLRLDADDLLGQTQRMRERLQEMEVRLETAQNKLALFEETYGPEQDREPLAQCYPSPMHTLWDSHAD